MGGRQRTRAWGATGPAFPLFAEVLLVGVVVGLASLPLVTALPALAAGVRHLRGHLDGRDDSIGGLLREVGYAVRRLWAPGVALVGALAVLGYNAWFATENDLPGGRALVAAAALLATALAVVALRLAGAWSDDRPWLEQAREAAGRAWQDPAGSVLLVAAVGVAAVLVWMLTPLFVVVGGLVAFAALAVEARFAALRDEPPAG